MAKILRMISWVLLTLLCAMTLLFSVGSAGVGYTNAEDQFGDVALTDLADGDEQLQKIIHGRRITAASFAAAYATLLLLVVLIPYRRGEVWAWWAILIATLVLSVMIWLRVPTLGLTLGASTGYTQLVVVVVALLLDVKRLAGSS
jgi:hypothetical protein